MPCPCHAHAIPLPCCAVNSHVPCRDPATLRQCCVLRESARGSRKYLNCYSNSLTYHLFCHVLLPLFTVVGIDRCEEVWYASDNNLRGTPRGSWKKPNAGWYPTDRLSTTVLCHGLEKNGMDKAWQVLIRHGRTM